MTQINLGVIIGSVRLNRATIRPAKAFIQQAENQFKTLITLDLLNLDLPMYDESHPKVEQKFLEAIKPCEALILIFPEYNYRPSPAILNALDYFRNYELKNKVLGLISVSNGNFGGVRAQMVMRASLPTFGCYLTSNTVTIQNVNKTFPLEGENDPIYKEKFQKLIEEVIQLTSKLNPKL